MSTTPTRHDTTPPVFHAPARVVIFDRYDNRASTGGEIAGLRTRLAALYRWCDAHKVEHLLEYIAWDPFAIRPPALLAAISLCRLQDASLLVYDTRTISPQPLFVAETLRDLTPHQLWTPEGRIVVNHFTQLAIISIPTDT